MTLNGFDLEDFEEKCQRSNMASVTVGGPSSVRSCFFSPVLGLGKADLLSSPAPKMLTSVAHSAPICCI